MESAAVTDGRTLKLELPNAAATEEMGRRVGEVIEAGHVLALIGDLGAGKTTLVRGLARGVGADPEQVHSPTFTMIHIYRGRLILYHVDLYRLDRPEQLDAIGFDETLEGRGSACAIEWADKFPGALPAGRLEIEILFDGGSRRAECRATDPPHARLLNDLDADGQGRWL